jgi:polygalacturonase
VTAVAQERRAEDSKIIVDVPNAIGDGEADDTGAIQRAIDLATTLRGGAVVRIRPGRYRIGTLFLRDRVTLHLEDRAYLVASHELGDFHRAPAYEDRIPGQGRRVLIYARSAREVGISGDGAIDGQDVAFWDVDKIDRPRLVLFEKCVDVRVEGVTFVRPSIYSLWMIDCQTVSVSEVKVVSGFEPRNTDGIHLESCRHVVIEDSSFVTGNDSIAIDGNGTGASEDVIVRRCDFDSSNNAVRVFTGLSPWSVASCGATENAVRNVLIEDLDVRDAAGCINVIAHSGVVENVRVRGIRARTRCSNWPTRIRVLSSMPTAPRGKYFTRCADGPESTPSLSSTAPIRT